MKLLLTNGQRESNPYLDARRNWNSQAEKALSNLHVFQLLCVVCLLIALAAVGGIVYIGSQSKIQPYLIEINGLGEAVAIGQAQLIGSADPRVIKAQLASFISSARLVTPDTELQKKAAWIVFGMLKTKDPATQRMQEWLDLGGKNAPLERAKRLMVNTEIESVLPMSSTSWEVNWTETTRDRDGGLIGPPTHWRAMLQVYILAPTNERDLKLNPIGIYVQDFTWESL
jgi:type IV secretion system protein TrbF